MHACVHGAAVPQGADPEGDIVLEPHPTENFIAVFKVVPKAAAKPEPAQAAVGPDGAPVQAADGALVVAQGDGAAGGKEPLMLNCRVRVVLCCAVLWERWALQGSFFLFLPVWVGTVEVCSGMFDT